MNTLREWVKKISADENGAITTEYALLAFFITAVVVIAVATVGLATKAQFCSFIEKIGSSCP